MYLLQFECQSLSQVLTHYCTLQFEIMTHWDIPITCSVHVDGCATMLHKLQIFIHRFSYYRLWDLKSFALQRFERSPSLNRYLLANPHQLRMLLLPASFQSMQLYFARGGIAGQAWNYGFSTWVQITENLHNCGFQELKPVLLPDGHLQCQCTGK